MGRAKSFCIFTAVIFLSFNIYHFSFSAESNDAKSKYPDFAYEFTGKDKFENFNRKVFGFNLKLNKYVIRPVNTVWASIMPKYGMDRIQSAYNNLEYPKRLASCLLQKDFKSSGKETVRFLTNSTLGLGGMYDPAKKFFKIEQRQEGIEQVLSKYKVKRGPYLVLPIIPPGNIRGLAGRLLDYPLDPSSYILGPVGAAVKGGLMTNKTSYMQPLLKSIESTYADPYDVTKKLYGIEDYIKNSDLDQKEVMAKIVDGQNIPKSNGNLVTTPTTPSNPDINPVKADVELEGFNPQCPVLDSMRTALFEDPDRNKSMWSELSVWNRSFTQRIKVGYVSLDPQRSKYRYGYILQKNKNAPLAILYPSIGENVMSHHSLVLAKMFYDEGYSVAMQGSTFQWEFVKSAPENYRPGFPNQDAEYARIITRKIISNLEKEEKCQFGERMLVGTSFGALTALFVAAAEENNDTLGVSNYISINPPVEIFFALKQLDKNSQEWSKDGSDIKMKAAVAAGKVLEASQNMSAYKNEDGKVDSLPFTDDEAKLITGFIMNQKLSDVVFTIENAPRSRKSDIYDKINNMSFDDYAQKYLLAGTGKSYEQVKYDASLYSLAGFLQRSTKYKIYHTLDDYFVNTQQLAWLKKQCNDKSVFFNNGAHLGFLYRKEFLDAFKKDIMIKNTISSAKTR